jgi:nucleoside-diphosphate-sugar epimerase
MARLLRLIATGMPLPLASIRNRRSFIFVDNLVDALLTVIGYPQPIRAVFVLSDGSDFSTPELIVALAGAAGRKARLVPAPFGMLRALGRLGDGVSRILGKPVGFDSYSVARLTGSLCVDGTCFREFFHWRPPVGSVDALARTAAALGRPGARS